MLLEGNDFFAENVFFYGFTLDTRERSLQVISRKVQILVRSVKILEKESVLEKILLPAL